jgi:hypothetical protein
MTRNVRYFSISLIILLLVQLSANRSPAQAPSTKQNHNALHLENVEITPVQGPSWLEHIHRRMNESSMGQTGLLGPTQEEGAAARLEALPPGGTLSLSGVDGDSAAHGLKIVRR